MSALRLRAWGSTSCLQPARRRTQLVVHLRPTCIPPLPFLLDTNDTTSSRTLTMPFLRAQETPVPLSDLPPQPVSFNLSANGDDLRPSCPQQQTVSGATEIPEINGSSAAFIALVVALGVVVLICSILVFVLLKWYNPTPYERQLRRARRLQAKQSRSSSPHSGFRAPSWLSKLARPFGRHQADGWVRANDEDWDARDELPYYKAHDELVRAQDRATAAPSPLHIDTHLPSSDDDPSADSVELQVPEQQGHVTSRYNDPFTSSPSPTSSEHSNSPPTPTDTREGRFSVQSSHHRQGSDAVSIRSMRKFENGTKFKEVLHF